MRIQRSERLDVSQSAAIGAQPRRQPTETIPTIADTRKAIQDRSPVPREWFTPSDLYGWFITLRILVPFFALLATAPWVWSRVSPWLVLLWLPALGVYGYKISFIMHDAAHVSLFRRRGLNDIVGQLCGFLVGSPFVPFKRLHMMHHKYNGAEGDVQRAEAWGFENASRGHLLWHLFGPLLGSRALGYVLGSGKAPSTSADASVRSGRSFYVSVLVAQVGIAALSTRLMAIPALLLLYPISAATFALFFARLRTFAEHVPPAGEAMADFTRSHETNLLTTALLCDAHFEFHREHHVYPQLPSCRLALLQDRDKDLIHPTSDTLRGSMFGTIVWRIAKAQS
jgi:fatty acid desaturase